MILALAKKELQLLSRDLHGVAVLFLMPTVFVLIMSLAIPSVDEIEKRQFPVRISLSSDDFYQQLFAAFVSNDQHLQVVENEESIATIKLLDDFGIEDLDRIEILLDRAAVDIEQVFIQQSIQTALAKVKLRDALLEMEVIDEEDSLQAQVKAIETEAEQVPLTLLGHNETVLPSPVQQSVPSWLIFGMFFVVMPFSQTLLKERQNSTIMRLRSFGLRSSAFLMSKLLPFFVINQIQFYLLIAIGYFLVPLFGGEAFKINGAWIDYGLLSIVISLLALSFASIVAVLVKTQEQAVVIGGGVNLILAAIGGIMIPKHLMSESIQTLSHLSPMAWSLEAFQALLLEGKGIMDIGNSLLVMLVFSFIMLALAITVFKRQFRTLGWNSAN